MPSEMQGLLLQSYTLEEFKLYLTKEVAPRMGAWHPAGAVLHNTGRMVWPGFDGHGVQITPAQRIKNISVYWVSRGFHGGPHLMVSPDGMIHTVWPLWMWGTHSPSYNHTHWGIEMVGDFDVEPFPDAMKIAVVGAVKALYAMLGRPITEESFKLHKEDPKTSHKHCPGANCGDKATWLARLTQSTVVQSAPHKNALAPSAFLKTTLKGMEAFRDKAYQLKGIWHIGWGFRDGFRGLHVDANSAMTRTEADKLFDESVAIQADTIQQMVHVPLKQNQLDALQLLAWNIGLSALEGSTVMKRLNMGDYAGAGAAFELWNKARKTPTDPLEVSQPLADRRAKERAIFDGKPATATIVPVNPVTVNNKPLPQIVVKPAASPPATPVSHVPAAMAPNPPPRPDPSQKFDRTDGSAPFWVRLLQWLLDTFAPKP